MSTLASPRSPSNSRIRRPSRASAWLRVMANQVLPTPPLPLAIDIMFRPVRAAGNVVTLPAGRADRPSVVIVMALRSVEVEPLPAFGRGDEDGPALPDQIGRAHV